MISNIFIFLILFLWALFAAAEIFLHFNYQHDSEKEQPKGVKTARYISEHVIWLFIATVVFHLIYGFFKSV